MATRRTKTQVEVPISPSLNGNNSASTSNKMGSAASKLSVPPPNHSPFLPTALEAILLALYPGTLVLGSLVSFLQPAARHATYLPEAQSYDPSHAPSYFAKKSNVFNVYFVKVGWFWTTLALLLLVFTHPSLGPPFRPALPRRRAQALLRWASVTAVWVGVTQWFFGPPIIDRSFRWTGGQCRMAASAVAGVDPVDAVEAGNAREVFTHAACRAIGGTWTGGHDISGHVFLLILGSAMLWLELLPAVLRAEGLREARCVRASSGGTERAGSDSGDGAGVGSAEGAGKGMGIGVKVALVVAGLSWWMLLMTAAYFHTWFEKLTGLLVAFSTIYTIYFLPRGIPALRNIVGMPGV